MILYYALGGGLGHLTRARKVLAALHIEDAALLTASRFAHDPRVTGGHPVVAVPRALGHDRAAFRAWLQATLHRLRPSELIVDSFPGGILGELSGMDLPPARYVARLLNWSAYAQRLTGRLPSYAVTYVLEPLTHHPGPAEPLALPHAEPGPPLDTDAHWLVVHAGPEHELEQLVARAAGAPKLLVIHPRHRDVYPVAPHLAHAERVITAAGFNAMQENVRWPEKHEAVPFPRALDDQFARAQKRFPGTPKQSTTRS